MEEIRLPELWKDWKITECVGQGSFGTVYKAERPGKGDKAEKEVIAVKVIPVPSDSADEAAVIREMHNTQTAQSFFRGMVDDYLREVISMNMLRDNDHVVNIRAYHVEENPKGIGWFLYIAMEFLQSLSDYQVTHPLGEEEIIRLGIDICKALDSCERAGIIHRDIKPDNIFVDENGSFKLGDFGVARNLDATAGTMSIKGSFSYMAPEVYNGHKYDSRADIYSLGLILYRYMNGGREPFIDSSKQLVYYQDKKEALQKRMDGETLPPPVNASPAFAKVILKACSARTAGRYRTGTEFREALEHLLVQESREQKRKRRIRLAAVSAAVVLAASGGGYWYYRQNRPKTLADYKDARIVEKFDDRYAEFVTGDGNAV